MITWAGVVAWFPANRCPVIIRVHRAIACPTSPMSRRTTVSRLATAAGAVTVSVRLNADSHARFRVAAARKGLSMGMFLADLWERSREAKAEAEAHRVDNRGQVDASMLQ